MRKGVQVGTEPGGCDGRTEHRDAEQNGEGHEQGQAAGDRLAGEPAAEADRRRLHALIPVLFPALP
jgi:hypothetical protein